MSGKGQGWAAGLPLANERVAEFNRLAGSMGSSPLVAAMIQRVIDVNRQLGTYELAGIPGWTTSLQAVQATADLALEALPIDMRRRGFMWPEDKPFPWSAEACRAAVIGYEVEWPGSFDDFLNHLRGKWEMSDGNAVPWQA